MTVGIMFDGAGVTQAQYDQVLQQTVPGDELPAGLLYHASGPTEGGFCVIEHWESQEAAQRFFEEKLGAAMQEAGINVQPKFFQVTKVLKP